MQDRQQALEEIAAEIAATGSFPLLLLDPNVLKQNVYPHVAIDMLGLFARTCQAAEAGTAFLRLMTAAVEAEPMSYSQEDETSLAAIAILKRHPELLFVKGMVTDHFGRKIFASPYQLLHGAGDVWALKQVHEEILPNIKDGEAIAQAQFKEQFPNCKLQFNPEMGEAALYDARNEAMIAKVIAQLKTIADVMAADPCTNGEATFDATTDAVVVLREIFAPKEGEVIKTGLHFPVAIMQEIYNVYAVIPVGDKSSFFSRELIGAALDASSAVDGQCYKVGLPNLNHEAGPDRRDGLFCRHPKGIPQELAPLRGKLGRTMFVDPYDGESCFQSSNKPGVFDCYDKIGRAAGGSVRGGGLVAGWWFSAFVALGKLMLSKNFRLAELMRPRREEKTSRCIIC